MPKSEKVRPDKGLLGFFRFREAFARALKARVLAMGLRKSERLIDDFGKHFIHCDRALVCTCM